MSDEPWNNYLREIGENLDLSEAYVPVNNDNGEAPRADLSMENASSWRVQPMEETVVGNAATQPSGTKQSYTAKDAAHKNETTVGNAASPRVGAQRSHTTIEHVERQRAPAQSQWPAAVGSERIAERQHGARHAPMLTQFNDGGELTLDGAGSRTAHTLPSQNAVDVLALDDIVKKDIDDSNALFILKQVRRLLSNHIVCFTLDRVIEQRKLLSEFISSRPKCSDPIWTLLEKASELLDAAEYRCSKITGPQERISMSSMDQISQSRSGNGLINSGPSVCYPKYVADEAIPKFDGHPLSWPNWSVGFNDLVASNPHIPETRKAYLLSLAMPLEFRTVVQDFEADWRGGLAEVRREMVDPARIRQDIMERLRKCPRLHEKATLDDWRKFRDTLAEFERNARPYFDLSETVKSSMLRLLPTEEYRKFIFDRGGSSLQDLRNFVKSIVRGHELMVSNPPSSSSSGTSRTESSGQRRHAYAVSVNDNSDRGDKRRYSPKCTFCDQAHWRKDCPLNRRERRAATRRKRLCYGCLRIWENDHRCEYRCKLCGRHEHILLCERSNQPRPESGKPVTETVAAVDTTVAITKAKETVTVETCSAISVAPAEHDQRTDEVILDEKQSIKCGDEKSDIVAMAVPGDEKSRIREIHPTVYLPTLILLAGTPDGTRQRPIRALLDSGSTSTFLSASAAAELGLEIRSTSPRVVHAFGGGSTLRVVAEVELVVTALGERSQKETITALVMDGLLVGQLPAPSLEVISDARRKGVELSDIGGGAERIDMVVGSDHLIELFVLPNQRCVKSSSGVAFIETRFGWVAQGRKLGWRNRNMYANCSYVVAVEEDRRDAPVEFEKIRCACEDLQALFRTPEFMQEPDPVQSEWIQKFAATIRFDEARKRTIVPLPWNGELRPDHNLALARAQCYSVKKRLMAQGYFDQYNDIINELVVNDFAEVVGGEPSSGYYIPHFPVFRSSATTPIRPVFNASMARVGERSLNDCIFKGTWPQTKLIDVLVKWRTHAKVVVSDLRKAFLQVEVRPEDRQYLRFIWFVHGELRMFEMRRLLFGASSSPYLLYAVLRYLFETIDPEMIGILEFIYVDDCLLVGNSNEELQSKLFRVAAVLEKASFEMHKWTAASATATVLGIEASSNDTSFLGVRWLVERDQICFSSLPPLSETLTRRKLASIFAKNFDPLGLLGPFHTKVKLFMREVVMATTSWDDPVSEALSDQASQLMDEFCQLRHFVFPRAVTSGTFELWAFGDASTYAYGAVLYVFDQESNQVNLLLSQSRLATMKSPTIPRLELAAAVLVAEVVTKTVAAMSTKPRAIRLFTDSQITWHRIQGDPSRLDQYVASRVKKIQDSVGVTCWYQVPSELNPADIISRGTSLQRLKIEQQWFRGPDVDRINTIVTKERDPHVSVATITGAPDSEIGNVFQRMMQMSYHTLQIFVYRLIRYMSRFVNLRRRHMEETGVELCEDLLAHVWMWRMIQSITMPDEVKNLKEGKPLSKASPWNGTRIFIDQNGLIRVDRRLKNSELEYETRFPLAIMDSPIARSFIKHIHISVGRHAGKRYTVNLVRQTIVIPSIHRVVGQIVGSCPQCLLRRGEPFVAELAPLPQDRVSEGRAFEVVGVDIFGPIHHGKRHLSKFYGLVFICAKSRAVHLELLQSRETSAIIRAFQRFFGVFGRPLKIRSDNEPGFVKMGKTMLAIRQRYEEAVGQLRESGIEPIQWIRNVPLAPWWGGLWERVIQTIKRSFDRVTIRAGTTYEELETLLREAQLYVNSRPLLCGDDGEAVISPAHLVFGRPLSSLAPVRFPRSSRDDQLLNYTRLQQWLERYWKIWKREYLTQLRINWRTPTRSPTRGEIVVEIADSPRYQWRLGRIHSLIPGRDGVVRAAEVQYLDGGHTVTRSVHRLVPIEKDLNTSLPTPVGPTSPAGGCRDKAATPELPRRAE